MGDKTAHRFIVWISTPIPAAIPTCRVDVWRISPHITRWDLIHWTQELILPRQLWHVKPNHIVWICSTNTAHRPTHQSITKIYHTDPSPAHWSIPLNPSHWSVHHTDPLPGFSTLIHHLNSPPCERCAGQSLDTESLERPSPHETWLTPKKLIMLRYSRYSLTGPMHTHYQSTHYSWTLQHASNALISHAIVVTLACKVNEWSAVDMKHPPSS